MNNFSSRFVERTLTDINQALERSWFADAIARRPGLLQSFDPRGKLISLMALLVATSISHTLLGIAVIFPVVLVLAILSQISVWFFIRRVWALAFLFTGALALPALFLTPGSTIVSLAPGIFISQTGVQAAAFLCLRAGASISLATLFMLTTPWNNLLRALGVLRVPDVIILIFGMTYRYIHLLLHTANDMFLARKSRILRETEKTQGRKFIGATIGVLLGKSLHLSEDVYLAMQARGYRGYPRTLDQFQFRWRDALAFAATCLLMFLVIRGA
jgi:cobalt/nickel transport system permease protein